MMRPTRTTALLAVAVTVAAIGLSGCAQGAPGVVAEVGSTTITESQLNAAYDGVTEAFGADAGPVSKQAVVDALVRGAIGDQIEASNSIDITDAERDKALLADQTGTLLLSNEQSKAVAYDLADEQILVAKLGEQTYVQQLSAAEVVLNPRYGTWRSQVLATSGSLSTSVASPSPSASR